MTTYTWTGTGSDDLWSNANNWSPNSGPPAAFDTAVIGTDDNSIAVNGTSGVGDLDLGLFFFGSAVGSTVTVDNGATLDVDGASDIFSASTLQSQTGGTLSFDFTGTLGNNGTVLVGQDFNGAGDSGNLAIDGAVTLSGSGTIELGEVTASLLSRPSTGAIENSPNISDSLINQSNTIAGAGSITLGTFDNQADGTVDAGLSGFGTLAIAAGTFSNQGKMVVETSATLRLGQDSASASLTNTGTITLDNASTLAIGGNFTMSGDGGVLLAPESAQAEFTTDQIVSDGNPAQLTLIGQTLKGAGTIGDSNLTLDNEGGIDADVPNQILDLNTGGTSGNLISNGGTLAAFNDGILTLASPVVNAGTIEANGGTVDIVAAVSAPFFPPGAHSTIDVGANGVLVLQASVAGNVTFTSGGAILELDSGANGGIGGAIVGAEATDVILFDVPPSSSLQTSWQQNGNSGTLSLVEGGTTLASVNLAGAYTNSDFTVLASSGATYVELQNPNPPSAVTADMIMEDGGTGDFEIYDLGSNAIQAGDALGQPFAFGAGEAAASGAEAGPDWQVAGLWGLGAVVGFTSDMMLRNSLTGAFEIWNVVNNNIISWAAMGQVGLEWSVAGFGDFSGNVLETDMLMRNSNTGAFEIYDISNNAITNAAPMGQVGPEWTVAGFGDFSTRANETDMLMRDTSTGQFEVYDISNNTISFSASMGQVGLEWSVAGFGDFSGNANETDMLMRNNNTGAFEIYDISNNTITNYASMGQVGLEWQVAGFGAIDGTGASDMLMRNTSTGAFEFYDITNNQLGNAGPMGQVGTEWSVAGIAAAENVQFAQAMAAYAPGNSVPDVSSPPGQTTMPVPAASPLATHT